MKFVELSDGTSINVDFVRGFQRVSDTETAVWLGEDTITTKLPYDTLKVLLSKQVKLSSSDALTQLAKLQVVQTP